MLKNYFKTAWRSLWKNKGFSILNILGLATGLAVCLLIILYVVNELSYDRYNVNADRIYRIDADIYFNSTQATFAVAPDPMPAALVRDFPEVEQMVRINNQGGILIKKDNQNIQDQHAAFADSTFFKVFTVHMIAGDPNTALTGPNSIVIDESAAKRYFNNVDVVGKTLFVDNSTLCKITGVYKDMPKQSHFHFSFLRQRGKANDSWLSNNASCFILVKPGVTREKVQRDVDATVNNYLAKELQDQLHSSLTELKKKGNHFIYHLMPLTDIHLHSDKSYEIEANGNITYVYIFSVIAALILLIACVNFMNLSTARSANRAKEVGIRKVSGSQRSHLIIQFLAESIMVTFMSLALAILIAMLLLPLFNDLAGKEMHASTLFSTWLLPVMLALVLVVGLIAGSYPAFYLSSFQPIQVLKGKIANGFKTSWLRNGLVVFQFMISIALIVGTIVIYNQLNFIRNRKIGYNRDQVLVVHNAWYLDNQTKTFANEMLGIPGVTNSTITGDLPTATSFDNEGWFRDANFDATRVVVLNNFTVDENYVQTLGMQMADGRSFSKEFPSDSTAIILNETAVKVLGLKDPLKETLYRPNFNDGAIKGAIGYRIIGVIKDFNFSSMHQQVAPLLIMEGDSRGSIALRFHTKNIASVINSVESKWKSMVPSEPFNYSFMDADFNKMYASEEQTGKLFITFAVFAIFIGCLGLFGLVTYAAEQRTKEIGVRKVLGASVGGIVGMLSKDFARLIVIAALIAFPFSWWAMHRWLESFAYRTSISWWVFFAAAFVTLAIGLITVIIQAMKAALANPIRSLRTE